MERLPAALEAAAIRRAAESSGGFATVLHRGDADRGSLLLVIAERGRHYACLERALQADGGYRWQAVGPESGAVPETIAEFAAKRIRFDADIWLIELDIPLAERFVAEMRHSG